jgi:uncharacterized protein (DUF983 family)
MITLKLSHVNKHTRAKNDGTQIICPKCTKSVIVYHFCWCGLSCQNCGKSIDKNDWYIIKKTIVQNSY